MLKTFRDNTFSVTREIFSAGLDWIAPRTCCRCDRVLMSNVAGPGDWCSDCRSHLPDRPEWTCATCGAPTGPFVNTASGCQLCRGPREVYSGVISLGAYRDELGKMCRLGKKPHGQRLVQELTTLLWQRERSRLESWNCAAIVPVPMFWRERMIRHVHPCETIAAELSGCLRWPVNRHLLYRSRSLPKQSRLPPQERRQSAKNAYGCRRLGALAGKSILLVDDILTTGATASVCARQLKTRGAAAVYVAVLARGLGVR